MSIAPATAPTAASEIVAGAPLFRFTPEKYRAMVRDGILTEDDPFEYLQGVLVEKMTKSDRHIAVVWFLRRLLDRLLAPQYFTHCQDPIDLVDSEPEPDLAVVRGDPAELFQRKPTAADIALIIEVSDSTLRRDREFKGPVYAAAGIATYWIVNLVDDVVETYSGPDPAVSPARYRSTQIVNPGGQLCLPIGDSVRAIQVSDILGL